MQFKQITESLISKTLVLVHFLCEKLHISQIVSFAVFVITLINSYQSVSLCTVFYVFLFSMFFLY